MRVPSGDQVGSVSWISATSVGVTLTECASPVANVTTQTCGGS
jgi:hypothetical protein